MKKIKWFILLVLLAILLIYITNINAMPNSVVLFKGENLNLQTVFGITINENKTYGAVQTSTNINETQVLEKSKATLKLFDVFSIKEVEVNRVPKTTIIPLGNTVGLKLYTSGVLVVGKSKINGKEPYQNSGIEEGDIITKINESEITCTSDLINTVANSNGEDLTVEFVRDGTELSGNIEPIKTNDNEYKIGLWVRDGAAGIGTVTYYEPSSKKFAALGHGILDVDTQKLITISSGEILTSKISSIVKGEKGIPGEIRGSIANGKNLGTVGKNTNFGIYGTLTNTNELNVNTQNEIEVATREEIKKGEAYILLTLEDGIREKYTAEITKIYKNNNYDNKSMLIKITDKELLEKTGGIVQGMSGAPIIQNGKFIGAITHVLVSDPKQGYAVFGDLMIKEMSTI